MHPDRRPILNPLQQARRAELKLGQSMLAIIQTRRKKDHFRGTTNRLLVRDTGYSPATIYSWEKGGKIPARAQAAVFEALGLFSLRDEALRIDRDLSQHRSLGLRA